MPLADAAAIFADERTFKAPALTRPVVDGRAM